MVGNFVDIEALLIDWHKTVLGYINVSTEEPTNLVDLTRTNPVIVLDRYGGADRVPTIDVARVDISVYANSLDGAKQHAETIRAAIRTRLVHRIHGGAVVARVETMSAPMRLPYDSRNLVRRVGASYQITTHQFAGVG